MKAGRQNFESAMIEVLLCTSMNVALPFQLVQNMSRFRKGKLEATFTLDAIIDY